MNSKVICLTQLVHFLITFGPSIIVWTVYWQSRQKIGVTRTLTRSVGQCWIFPVYLSQPKKMFLWQTGMVCLYVCLFWVFVVVVLLLGFFWGGWFVFCCCFSKLYFLYQESHSVTWRSQFNVIFRTCASVSEHSHSHPPSPSPYETFPCVKQCSQPNFIFRVKRLPVLPSTVNYKPAVCMYSSNFLMTYWTYPFLVNFHFSSFFFFSFFLSLHTSFCSTRKAVETSKYHGWKINSSALTSELVQTF